MSELFETINMKALDQAEQERIDFEERQIERKRAARYKRRKATKALLIRVAVAAVLFIAMWVAGKFDLMADVLILWLYGGVAAWLCIWCGAWYQFMWCKGGLLEC